MTGFSVILLVPEAPTKGDKTRSQFLSDLARDLLGFYVEGCRGLSTTPKLRAYGGTKLILRFSFIGRVLTVYNIGASTM